jgi:formylglycine-generating enzyme required for sulfatase activity
MSVHFFISYAKKDTRDLATALVTALQNIPNVTAWMDTSIEIGSSWVIDIQKQIDQCDWMIVLYSEDINRHKRGEENSFVLNEITYGRYTAKKRIIPVMAQQTDPPMLLSDVQHIDYAAGDMTLNALVEQICAKAGIPVTPPPPPPPPPPDPILLALNIARNFRGAHNRDWTPYAAALPDCRLADIKFCLVPVGNFAMGSTDGFYNDETPVKVQEITQPYWISQHTITNAQWAQAVTEGAVRPPLQIGRANDWYRGTAFANHPVVGITWLMARDFAQWVGGRLPTEVEWEYAARGIESWRYPWGNEWNKSIPWFGSNSSGSPSPVTSAPAGTSLAQTASWVGAYHMTGNVWEWTASLYDSYPYERSGQRERDLRATDELPRVMRGGSWESPTYDNTLRAAYRRARPISEAAIDRGLRIAISSN